MESNNRRLAKNTLLLYFRMLFLSVIGLFTVRITLQTLGVMDYGIYNVVGSLVTSMSFLTTTLGSASQRYFSFNLGKNDLEGYSKVFSILILSYLFLSAGVLLIGEILGLIILPKLTIPTESISSAHWAYHTALATFIVNLLVVPYTASMIAHERMKGFAYISIVDGIAKLGLVYLLYLTPHDKLKFYATLILIEAILSSGMYYVYCRRNFPVCRYRFYWDKSQFKELFSYTGWNLFGSVSAMLATQGQNILLNIFFGPVINTAKNIADKVSSVIQSFSTNYYLAVSPQIIKSYAAKEQERFFSLVMRSSKLSFFLLLVISFPLMECCSDLLSLWLGKDSVTYEMIIFTKLTLVFCLLTTLDQPITYAIRATGKLRLYQVSVGSIMLLFIPVAALILWMGYSPQSTMYTLIGIYSLSFSVRFLIIRRQLDFPIARYFKKVLFPILGVCLVISIISKIIHIYDSKLLGSILPGGLLAFIIVCLIVIAFGIDREERKFIFSKLIRLK